jgi:hypothetical protein
VEILVLDIFEGFFVGGDTFEPTERSDHAEEEMEFGVFDDLGLLKEDGFGGIEPGGKEIDGDLERVFGDGGRVGVIAREGVPIGDEVKAFVGEIVLETDPVLQGAKVMADVETACGAHAG